MDLITSRLDLQFGSFPEPVIFLAGGQAVYSNEPGQQLLQAKPVPWICWLPWQSIPAGRWRLPWGRPPIG